MDPTAIISEIETIRLNDFQVCQRINLIETQINRLKRPERETIIDTDSTLRFRIEAENDHLSMRQQQIIGFTKSLCLRFDSEIQKLNEACERQTKRIRQQLGYDETQEKVTHAHERLAQAREELALLRTEQTHLTHQIEAERQLQKAHESAIAEMQNFLKFGKALRQSVTRLHVSQKQLQALDKRIAVMRAKSTARPNRTPPTTGGGRIPQSFQDVSGISRRSGQHASGATPSAGAVLQTNASSMPPPVARIQAREAPAAPSPAALKQARNSTIVKGKQARHPIGGSVNISKTSSKQTEPPAVTPNEANNFYESVWADDFDYLEAPCNQLNQMPPQRQVYSLSGSDDDSAIYID